MKGVDHVVKAQLERRVDQTVMGQLAGVELTAGVEEAAGAEGALFVGELEMLADAPGVGGGKLIDRDLGVPVYRTSLSLDPVRYCMHVKLGAISDQFIARHRDRTLRTGGHCRLWGTDVISVKTFCLRSTSAELIGHCPHHWRWLL